MSQTEMLEQEVIMDSQKSKTVMGEGGDQFVVGGEELGGMEHNFNAGELSLILEKLPAQGKKACCRTVGGGTPILLRVEKRVASTNLEGIPNLLLFFLKLQILFFPKLLFI